MKEYFIEEKYVNIEEIRNDGKKESIVLIVLYIVVMMVFWTIGIK